MGGRRDAAAGDATPRPQGARINMLTAIRRTLEHELAVNPRVLVFGEDVGRKGGVHAATLGLQERFGEDRVFDTSLSEEGIIGRAVGMALAGLMPVPEIQFRKYAEPAAEQLHDCGTIRWRTVNRFAAPMVVRMPGGFFKCGDPWHSQCNEVQFLHAVGWQLAMPSNAEDAVGLLRTALRGNEPVIFFEHRFLLDGAAGRRPWPGDDFVLPFGKANRVREGIGAHRGHLGRDGRALRAGRGGSPRSTSSSSTSAPCAPGTASAVLESVAKTRRCLDRARRHDHRGLRRRDRGPARRARLLRPRCAGRAPRHARRSEPAQPAPAWMRWCPASVISWRRCAALRASER